MNQNNVDLIIDRLKSQLPRSLVGNSNDSFEDILDLLGAVGILMKGVKQFSEKEMIDEDLKLCLLNQLYNMEICVAFLRETMEEGWRHVNPGVTYPDGGARDILMFLGYDLETMKQLKN